MSARRADGLALVPLALLVHNAEEALSFGALRPRIAALGSALLPHPPALPTAAQLRLALALLTAAVALLWLLARAWEPAAYALVVVQAVMALNVVSHAAAAGLLGGYAPGLLTALLVEAPTSVVVYRRLRADPWMSPRQWRLLPVLAILLHGPALVALLLGVART